MPKFWTESSSIHLTWAKQQSPSSVNCAGKNLWELSDYIIYATDAQYAIWNSVAFTSCSIVCTLPVLDWTHFFLPNCLDPCVIDSVSCWKHSFKWIHVDHVYMSKCSGLLPYDWLIRNALMSSWTGVAVWKCHSVSENSTELWKLSKMPPL